jgi:hypothetical protein
MAVHYPTSKQALHAHAWALREYDASPTCARHKHVADVLWRYAHTVRSQQYAYKQCAHTCVLQVIQLTTVGHAQLIHIHNIREYTSASATSTQCFFLRARRSLLYTQRLVGKPRIDMP